MIDEQLRKWHSTMHSRLPHIAGGLHSSSLPTYRLHCSSSRTMPHIHCLPVPSTHNLPVHHRKHTQNDFTRQIITCNQKYMLGTSPFHNKSSPKDILDLGLHIIKLYFFTKGPSTTMARLIQANQFSEIICIMLNFNTGCPT